MISVKHSYQTIAHSPSEMAKKMLFFVQDVGWFICAPDYHMKRTFYYYQLKYVVRGTGYLIWQGRKYKLRPGEMFFLDLTQMHQYYADPDDPWELLWFRFGGVTVLDYYRLLECSRPPVFRSRNPIAMRGMFMNLFNMFKLRPFGLEIAASSLITQIISEIVITKMENDGDQPLHLSPMYPKEVQQALGYIEKHFSSPIKLEEVADHIHLSPYYFSRIFKRSTGYSVMEYVIKYRLTRSKHLLMFTKLSSGQIALNVGFCSHSYFTKMFKTYEGMTPKEYRKSIQ
ncbi:helix-turn-helix domain-containing protein [Paenibacillus ginsengarvi]|uniref:AraC family transcriptional regulator n=1 Tax=Paenibacillus ginsengarvi TaxID=400777 RepID=A0A3B0AMR3_9BACL|nr:AraC family transcriptional regulator [Paenibacillus ginsengarvi]RKN61939.1 AraC family transcriptional regulator [Paenibacillus ginsengarvi]